MGNYAKSARFHEVDKSDVRELFQPYVKSLTNEGFVGADSYKVERDGFAVYIQKRESLKYQFFFLKTFLKLLGLFVKMTFPRIFCICIK